MVALQAAVATATHAAPPSPADSGIPMALLELELSLDGFSGSKDDFTAFIRTVADNVGGEFLFALPASGLIENCLSIAVLRLGETQADTSPILFVCLEEEGSTIRLEHPGESTQDLKSFAESFVGVLERI